jgi:hypothetical protein
MANTCLSPTNPCPPTNPHLLPLISTLPINRGARGSLMPSQAISWQLTPTHSHSHSHTSTCIVRSFIGSFVLLFIVCSFVRPIIQSFVQSFIQLSWFIRSFIRFFRSFDCSSKLNYCPSVMLLKF